jgi:uncharacterized Zn finger protein (UPF0148 family)
MKMVYCPNCGLPLDKPGITHGHGMYPCHEETEKETEQREFHEKMERKWEDKKKELEKKFPNMKIR